MKRCIVVILLMFMLFLSACYAEREVNEDYLRIHIRANSNSSIDQEIKLVVRDSIVKYLSPLLSEAKSRERAEEIILSHMDEIECVVNELLYSCGFFYGCNIAIDTEFFEEKSYGGLVLGEGYYRAVIVNLGSGNGNNWWCVAFPPLCFTSDDYENANYKSILVQIVKKYLEKEGK